MERPIVLDTNCLLQIFSRNSSRYYIWESFLNGEFTLCVTTDILEEYEEILGIKANQTVASMVVNIIRQSPNVMFIDARYHWNLITSDPDDNKFVDCAIVANADFIVTEDRHFSHLSSIKFPRVSILGLDEFGKMITQKAN